MAFEVTLRSPVASRWFPWPKRLDISLLSFLAMIVAYCDRFNLSVTAPLIMQDGCGSVELAPRYAGTVGGIQNCFANLAGVMVPVIVGYGVKIIGWTSAFWLTAAVSWIGISLFLVFGKSERLVD